jgi:hypothetical protein
MLVGKLSPPLKTIFASNLGSLMIGPFFDCGLEMAALTDDKDEYWEGSIRARINMVIRDITYDNDNDNDNVGILEIYSLVKYLHIIICMF